MGLDYTLCSVGIIDLFFIYGVIETESYNTPFIESFKVKNLELCSIPYLDVFFWKCMETLKYVIIYYLKSLEEAVLGLSGGLLILG